MLDGEWTDLVDHLTADCRDDDLGKVRAFFKFLTEQDLNRLKGDSKPGTIKNLLKILKDDPNKYNEIFQSLCKYVIEIFHN